MDAYYVRVYHTKDGSNVEISAIYESYADAEAALSTFNPSGEGVDDLDSVKYAKIEKRFSPTPLWKEEA